MENYTSRNADKFVLRMPEGLRDQIKDLAKANRRSMNQQMLVMLTNQTESIPAQLEETWVPQIGQLVQPRHITADWGADEFGTIVGFVKEEGILKVEVKHTTDDAHIERMSVALIRPAKITL